MKKTIFTLALLVMAMAAGAQTIKVNFKKGDVRKYATTSDFSMGIPMKGESKGSTTTLSTYTVTDATPDGYKVTYKVDSVSVDGASEVIQQVGDITNLKAIKDIPVKLSLDKNGYIKDLLNSDDVLAAVAKISIETVNKLYAEKPEIEKVIPKAKALMAVNEKINKENFLKTLRTSTIFSLNGKDIKTGTTEDEEFYEGLKVKSGYTVSNADGKLVITKTSASNMKDDDIKAFLKQQMSKAGTVSDADFDAAWSQLKMFGMTKIDIDNNSTSTYSDSGWLTDQTSTSTIKAMGMTIKVNATTKAN